MLLLLSHRDTIDRRLVQKAANNTKILSSYRAEPELQGRDDLRIYAEPLFADVIASQLDLVLLEAPLDWLASVPSELVGRKIELTTLAKARQMSFPRFVKALDDKRILPKVYDKAKHIGDHESDTLVLTSPACKWDLEMRLFVVGGEVQTGSVYIKDNKPFQRPLGKQEFLMTQRFVDKTMSQIGDTLPIATVLDVGLAKQLTIVEANAAWASGLYASSPTKALSSIMASTCSGKEAALIDTKFHRAKAEVQF